MGNTHSVETIPESDVHSSPSKRAPQKLSKPRIGNHGSTSSTQAAALTGSPSRTPSRTPSRNPSVSLPPSRSNSRAFSQTHSPELSTFSPLPTDTASPTENFPPVPPEPESQPAPPARDWKRRASLFRSKSSQDARRKDKRRQTITVSPDVGDRMSRANSMTWESQKEMDHARRLQVDSWLVPGNRQSINYNLMSYESRRLLNLNEDLTACEENSIMSDSKFEASRFQVTQNTWKSSHPHQPAVTPTFEAAPTPRVSPIPRAAPIPRANSDVSLYAPVRRRSMVQTPGIATRIPSASDFAASRRSSFRHSMPTTPAGGRSRLNSIEGGFMALDELVAEPEPLPELLPPPVHEPVERALTPSDMDYRPLGAMKFGSLRITNGAASPIPSPDLEASETHRAMAEQLANDVETSGKEYGNQDVEITVSPVQPSSAAKAPSPVETATLVIDLPTLGVNSPLSPELKVASKHTAMEDELFEDDVQVEYSAEVLTVRNDPNAKPSLEQLQADQSQKLSQGVARADSGVVTSPTTEYQPKPLSKADSGYSSNVSLKSFNAKQNARGKDQRIHVALKESGDEKSNSVVVPNATVSAVGPINIGQVATTADGSGSDSASSTPPPLPPKDDYLATGGNTMTITSPRHLQFFNLSASSFRWDRKASVSFEMAQASETGPAALQPAAAPSAMANGSVPEASNAPMTIGSGSQRQSKLQRFLSGSSMRGPPATHTIHPADDPVPTVPQDVQAKLDEHSGRFPMSTKRLTLRTRESKDTLKTIFSVGSVDVGQAEDMPDSSPVERTIVVRKPVAQAAESDDTPKTPKTPKTPRRLSFSIAQAAASVMPRRSIRRKPVPLSTTEKGTEKVVSADQDSADEIQDGFESSVTAIGNVGESVGKSAFDQAFMAMPQEEHTMRPNERAFTMTPQMERSMGMHLRAHGQMPSMNSDRLPSPQSHLFPESVDSLSKRKTSPPVSLHTRSGKSLRKPAPLRPKSSGEGQQRRQSLSRQNSRETIHSYPSASPGAGSLDEAFAVPPVPPMSPRRYTMLEQQFPVRRQANEDKWRPTNRQSLHPNDARRSKRSMSTTTLPLQPPQLRHRASYDGYSHQYHGPIARGPAPVGPPASQSGAYYQQQLLKVEQQQWEQEDQFTSDVVQLSRTRSRSRSVHEHPNPPYRVLHSYNSPAYRNAPIWG